MSAPVIVVLAGVNGAGKSSIVGAQLREQGLTYFNPDESARRVGEARGCSIDEANALAWNEGKRRLEHAIESQSNYAFEATLGGSTIPRLLAEAADAGFEIFVWFVGLSSPEHHIARVRARVARGGHGIPEAKIRERWDTSRRNIIALMPFLTELKLFDNSREGNPARETIPEPVLLLHWRRGRIVAPSAEQMRATPDWARPIVARALQLQRLK
jgi:predicted ABC-type ATPase